MMRRSSLNFELTVALMVMLFWVESASCVPPARGVLVRVAEGACEVVVDLLDVEGGTRVCPIAADLIVVVAELTLAEKERRDAVIRISGPDGTERTVIVPSEHVGRSLGSAQRALRATRRDGAEGEGK